MIVAQFPANGGSGEQSLYQHYWNEPKCPYPIYVPSSFSLSVLLASVTADFFKETRQLLCFKLWFLNLNPTPFCQRAIILHKIYFNLLTGVLFQQCYVQRHWWQASNVLHYMNGNSCFIVTKNDPSTPLLPTLSFLPFLFNSKKKKKGVYFFVRKTQTEQL